MSEQAGDITSYNRDKRTILDYFLLAGGWFLSCISLVIIGLITYWAIKIPEKNVNSLPIINAIKGNIRVEPTEPGGKSFNDKNFKKINGYMSIKFKVILVLICISGKQLRNTRATIKYLIFIFYFV